jgi:hypothetical protein
MPGEFFGTTGAGIGGQALDPDNDALPIDF